MHFQIFPSKYYCETNQHIHEFFQRTLTGELDAGVGNAHQQGRFYGTSFLGVYMTDHLHFSIENSGIVLSFFGIGSVIGSWLGGMITDKIGEYRVQSLSLLLSVPLFCMIPLFKTEIGLAGIILAQSIVSETFRPANSVAITKYAKPENITRAFSLNRMAVNLGFSIGPALGGILSAISYEFLFYSNALAALLAGFMYIWFFTGRAKQAKKEAKKVKEAIEIKKKTLLIRMVNF